jgi:hypothetical protein
MIYVALTLWLFLILLTGAGLYRCWTKRLGGAVVDWLILPATLIAETLYAAGRLLTRRPIYYSLISPQDIEQDPCREGLSGKGGFLVALFSSFLAMVGCLGAIIALTQFLDQNVIASFYQASWFGLNPTVLPQELPTSVDGLWDVLRYQGTMVERLMETLRRLDWTDWPVPVFVYGAAIFTIRLASPRHDQRGMLAAGAIVIGILAALTAAIPSVKDAIFVDGWALLTYLWATLLLLLGATLLLQGATYLFRLFVPRRGE